MSKHWKDVKAAIEKDIDRIWFEEPEEVKMSRLGIFPSGAGSHDQVLGNLFFQACDTQAMLQARQHQRQIHIIILTFSMIIRDQMLGIV